MVKRNVVRKKTTTKETAKLSPLAVGFIVLFAVVILFSFSESTVMLYLIKYNLKDFFTEVFGSIRQLIEAFAK